MEHRLARARSFVVVNFLPLGFLVALAVALSFPLPGRQLGSLQLDDVRAVQAANNVCVFLVSGLTLNLADFAAAARNVRAPLVGVLCILLLTPCLAFGLVRLPLHPPEFAVGLAIFAAVPTTLGVGVALTTASRGNTALALFLTVCTNLLGTVSVPYLLRLVLAGSQVVSVNAADLTVKLLFTVLVPSAAGIALRAASPAVVAWVGRHRTALSLFSHCNLVCIVWTTMSSAAGVLLAQRAQDVIAVLAASTALHVVLLLLMHAVCVHLLRLPVRERVAVVISAWLVMAEATPLTLARCFVSLAPQQTRGDSISHSFPSSHTPPSTQSVRTKICAGRGDHHLLHHAQCCEARPLRRACSRWSTYSNTARLLASAPVRQAGPAG